MWYQSSCKLAVNVTISSCEKPTTKKPIQQQKQQLECLWHSQWLCVLIRNVGVFGIKTVEWWSENQFTSVCICWHLWQTRESAVLTYADDKSTGHISDLIWALFNSLPPQIRMKRNTNILWLTENSYRLHDVLKLAKLHNLARPWSDTTIRSVQSHFSSFLYFKKTACLFVATEFHWKHAEQKSVHINPLCDGWTKSIFRIITQITWNGTHEAISKQ